MTTLYFRGSVQEGIALALQESKCVACFIKDGGADSSRWENEYFEDAQIRMALKSKAITLRLEAGSQDANLLAAYYPIHSVPAFILVNNGQVILELKPSPEESMFKARLLTTLVSQPIRAGLSSSSQNSESRASETPLGTESDRSDASQSREKQSSSTGLEENVDAESASSPVPETSTTNAPPQNPVLDQGPSETRQLSAVESLLQERRRRLDVDKKAKEETEKAERKAKSEARKESVSKAPESVKAEQATYAQEQRRRQQEAKVARERILREIEHDKAERKEKEERRKALAQAEADGLLDEVTVPEKTKVSKPNLSDAKATENPQDTAPTSKPCAIQVRLFDGSTIRNRFPTSQTLKDIRDWVDSEKSDDIPYTFKQILTPLPNRPLTISEESESLSELGFFPSATLVTIPIQGYTAAYSEAGSGILSKGVSAGYNTVATGVGMLSGALGTFLGIGQATTQPAPPAEEAPQANNPERAHTTGGASINVRTLRDQRDPKTDHQLYNGNQLNFEPRKDEDKKDD